MRILSFFAGEEETQLRIKYSHQLINVAMVGGSAWLVIAYFPNWWLWLLILPWSGSLILAFLTPFVEDSWRDRIVAPAVVLIPVFMGLVAVADVVYPVLSEKRIRRGMAALGYLAILVAAAIPVFD